MEISNLPDKEFKVMVIEMLTECGRRMHKHSENFNKETENIKKYYTEVMELKNTITEPKITLGGFNSRLDKTEERISDLEDRVVELTQQEQHKEKKKMKKSEDSPRYLWNDFKQKNICIIGVPEGEETEKGAENLPEEIMAVKTSLTWGKRQTSRFRKPREFPKRQTQKDPHRDIL